MRMKILPARQIGGVAEAVEYTVELDFFLLMTRLNELIGRCVSRNPPKYENLKRYQFLMLQWLNEMKECQWFIPLTGFAFGFVLIGLRLRGAYQSAAPACC